MSNPEHTSVVAEEAVTTHPAPDFDVREFARTAAGSHREKLNLDHYRTTPLTPEIVRLLSYLQVIERATMTHLRSVLVTATHKDARITAFLTTWAFEKYWVADALEQLVAANRPADHIPSPSPLRLPAERTIRESIAANVIGLPMIAVHMSLGTVDEWITQAAYRRISAIAASTQLSATITEFLAIKTRQLRFFEAQARFRLTESRRARVLTRRRLARTPWPIGSRAEPRAETQFFFERLFGSVESLAREIDARVDSLPGQARLSVVARAVGA